MSTYVVNPLTGRVIRKDGQTYRKWRRAHPGEAEPPSVDPHRHNHHHHHHQHHHLQHPRHTSHGKLVSRSLRKATEIAAQKCGYDTHHHQQQQEQQEQQQEQKQQSSQVSNRTLKRDVKQGHRCHFCGQALLTDQLQKEDNYETREKLSVDDTRTLQGQEQNLREQDDDADDNDDDDDDEAIHRLLVQHGPSLLRAFEDPDQDFMQVLMNTYQDITR